jgi:hypothetical protein
LYAWVTFGGREVQVELALAVSKENHAPSANAERIEGQSCVPA